MANPAPGTELLRPATESLQILAEASELVAGHSLELDDLLRALAELIRKVVEYQLFAVLLADEEGTLSIRYSIGYRSELVRNLRLRPGEGITGDAADRRQTVLVQDVSSDPRYIMAIDAVRSEIAVPLLARGKVVGVVDLQSSSKDAFGETERSILELIASRFSLAIDAAQLYQATVRQNAVFRTLSQIAADFAQILQLEQLLTKVSSLVRERVRYDAFSIYLAESEGGPLKHYFGVRFDERVQWQSLPLGQGIVGNAAQQRAAIVSPDTERDPRYITATHGIRSELAIPLLLQDHLIGVLDLESERLDAFTPEDAQMLSLLAPQLAAAIENARLYEQVARSQQRLQRDLTAARELQRHLLPSSCPRYPGLQVAAKNVPAAEVSGDFYDFYLDDNRFGIMNGDVSGKGAAAALYAALVSGVLRNLAAQRVGPRDLLEAVNQALLSRRIEARYLVALFLEWRPHDRTLTIAAAGQPRPILLRGGRIQVLDLGGTPLGMLDPGIHDELTLELEPDDYVITASDGLHETEDAAGRAYGDERLFELLAAQRPSSARELVDAIFADATRFSGRETPTDDRTVIVLKVL